MGYRGYRVVKFRGRHWIFYNHWDSGYEDMGESLVGTIPTNRQRYKQWLQAQRKFFLKWDKLLQQKLCIDHETLMSMEFPKSYRNPCEVAFDERINDMPIYIPGELDASIQHIYTFDLDREVFSIDNGAHYRLDKIPRGSNDCRWVEAIKRDNDGNKFVHPKKVPKSSLASLTVGNQGFSPDALETWTSLDARQVKPKRSSHSIGSSLRWEIFNIFQKRQSKCLSVTLLGWTAKSLPFRELAFYILCIAAGGNNLAIVDDCRIIYPSHGQLYAGMVAGDSQSGDREFISAMGVGYHMQGQPLGIAPEASKYWFEDVLVCLTPRLDQPDVLQKAIADAICFGQDDSLRKSFNAVLISIEHLVLLRSFPDGQAEYSHLMPLVSIPIHLSKNAVDRYGQDWLDDFYHRKGKKRARKEEAIKELSESSPSSKCQQKPASDQEKDDSDFGSDSDSESESDFGNYVDSGSEDISGNDKSVDPDAWTNKETFLALALVFESTALERLKPKEVQGRKLPTEVIAMILGNVFDVKTQNACEKVSRSFRALCHQRPLLMDDVVLLAQPPDQSEDDAGKQVLYSFHAIQPLTGKQTSFNVVSKVDDREVEVVIGSKWNRKGFAAYCPFSLKGFDLPQPWEKTKTVSNRRLEAPPWTRESTSAFWQNAFDGRLFDRINITADSPSITLSDFWKQATDSLFDIGINEDRYWSYARLHAPSEDDWLRLPNTRHLLSSTNPQLHEEYYHVLYMRMKAASNDWDTLWEDLIQETTIFLGKTGLWDLTVVTSLDWMEKHPVGAYDPFVMLAVGIEIRLFQWRSGFDVSVKRSARIGPTPNGALYELHPGRSFLLSNEGDRQVIKEFLNSVAARLKAAKLKDPTKPLVSDDESE